MAKHPILQIREVQKQNQSNIAQPFPLIKIASLDSLKRWSVGPHAGIECLRPAWLQGRLETTGKGFRLGHAHPYGERITDQQKTGLVGKRNIFRSIPAPESLRSDEFLQTDGPKTFAPSAILSQPVVKKQDPESGH